MRSILDWAARAVGITAGVSGAELAEQARCVQHLRVLKEKRERIEGYFWAELERIFRARGCKISLNPVRNTSSFSDVKKIVIDDLNFVRKDANYNFSARSIKKLFVEDFVNPFIEAGINLKISMIANRCLQQALSEERFKQSLEKKAVIPMEQLLPDLEAADARRCKIETEIHHLQALRGVINELR